MPNHVNLNRPNNDTRNQNIGLAVTGLITSAQPARSMQLGLKFVF